MISKDIPCRQNAFTLTYWLKISQFWFEDTPQLISGFLASESKFPLKKAEYVQRGNESMDSCPFSSDHLFYETPGYLLYWEIANAKMVQITNVWWKISIAYSHTSVVKTPKKNQFAPAFVVAECERTLIKHNNHAKWIWDLSIYVILRLKYRSVIRQGLIIS